MQTLPFVNGDNANVLQRRFQSLHAGSGEDSDAKSTGGRRGSGLSIDLVAPFRYVRSHGEKTAGGIRRGLLPRDCPR
jgi:hypothetical protein